MDLNSLKSIADLSPNKIIHLLLFGSLFYNYTLIKEKDLQEREHRLEVKSLNKIHAIELKFERDKTEKKQQEKIDFIEKELRNRIFLEKTIDSLKITSK